MISVLSFNRKIAEQSLVEKSCQHEVAMRTDDELNFIKILVERELAKYRSDDALLDIIFYEISNDADIDELKVLRTSASESLLVLMTSPEISPMKYLKPKIAPDSLILRPIQPELLAESSKELFEAFFAGRESVDTSASFVLKSRDTKTLFPYEKISYFEASNKKINLRVENEEYDFYDSIENIAGMVPDYFIRCHRAYLINSKKIKRVCMADNIIELQSGAIVPLSRTYRQNIRELIR